MSEKWFEKSEKASPFWISLTLFLVKNLPRRILRFCAFFVALFYCIKASNERANINKFYHLLDNYNSVATTKNPFRAFYNFYEFAISITDKLAVWCSKISQDDLVLKSGVDELFINPKSGGKIVLLSHFGNPEIAKAIGENRGLKMAIFAHYANTQNFANTLLELSKGDAKIFMVEALDINAMIEISKFINEGGYLFIAADRATMSGDKISNVEFLNATALFSQGPFFLAAILKCEIWALWCERFGNKFSIECEKIADKIDKKEVDTALNRYTKSLEKRCINNPKMWFNFYDFWGEYERV